MIAVLVAVAPVAALAHCRDEKAFDDSDDDNHNIVVVAVGRDCVAAPPVRLVVQRVRRCRRHCRYGDADGDADGDDNVDRRRRCRSRGWDNPENEAEPSARTRNSRTCTGRWDRSSARLLCSRRPLSP